MRIAPDLIGCALDGRYELRELIGEGTFGRVYRGFDRRLERDVAIKVIKPWWAEDPDWADSFGREAQMLARVSSPGIVQIYDVGQAEEGLYYVTELVEGESLSALLRREGRLSPRRGCEIAEQVCRALERAHGEQIVHRDIKPANVLISTRGQVKVGDLGIARLAEGGTTDGGTATIVGTPRYMAPEQADGRQVTPATDVYSAGIVLYEMLAGHPPFGGESAVEIALRHVQEPVPPLPDGTPAALRQIVGRALEKDPRDRYQNAAEMARALERARTEPPSGGAARTASGGAGHTASGRPGTTWVAPQYSARRNVNPAARRRSIALFVLALAVLAVLAVAAGLLTGPARVKLPQLRGMGERRVDARLARLHLHANFTRAYDAHARPGNVVSQSPAAGSRVKVGSTIAVIVSKGPRPVTVPKLVGMSSAAAAEKLKGIGLNDRIRTVPAPGTAPGIVTRQLSPAGVQLGPRSTVTLLTAEVPSWQYVTSFSGSGGGQSLPFKIRGTQWRVVYTMSYQGTCDFVFFCLGPSAQVLGVGATNSTDASFDLNSGSGQTRVFKTGAGVYQIAIKSGWDSASWSFEVEDWY